MTKPRSWGSDEDEILTQGWLTGVSVEAIASELGRTLDMVKNRVRKLGLCRTAEYLSEIRHAQSTGRKNPNASWTDLEEELIRELYEVEGMTVSEIHTHMPHKSQQAIKVKLTRLKLRHTQEQTHDALSRKLKGGLNGMFGKVGPRGGVRMSDAQRDTLRIKALEGYRTGARKKMWGTNNPMWGKVSTMRGRVISESAKLTLATKAKERWNKADPDQRHKILTALRLGVIHSAISGKMTWIERLVHDWLTGWSIAFEFQKLFEGYVVDFMVNTKVIEVNGDYWHANPDVYPRDSRNAMQKVNNRRDAHKRRLIAQNGFEILTLWERDLKKRPYWCKDQILEFLCPA